MVVVRHQKEVLSWQVPLVVTSDSGKIEFNKTARTLCPDGIENIKNEYQTTEKNSLEPIISISTAAQTNISFNLIVYKDIEFFINSSVEYSITASPSESR